MGGTAAPPPVRCVQEPDECSICGATRWRGLRDASRGAPEAPGAILGSLERQQYSSQGFLGFVFGFKADDTWQFYFYGNGTGGDGVVKRMV
jgi:hypothetical protein